jgi:hypothetical protein
VFFLPATVGLFCPDSGAGIAVSLAVPKRCSAITTSDIYPLPFSFGLLGVLSKYLLVVVARQSVLVVGWTENGTLEVAAPLAAHHLAGIAE